eukprot:m.451828 g.451828  ORF g.451828 m.451828 type:complete len:69 (+) comp20215_c0_seq1:51-257(+)
MERQASETAQCRRVPMIEALYMDPIGPFFSLRKNSFKRFTLLMYAQRQMNSSTTTIMPSREYAFMTRQ